MKLKNHILISLSLVFLVVNSKAQVPISSGHIFFSDGTNQKFKSVKCIFETPNIDANSIDCKYELIVFFQNSERKIPFDKLKEIIVKPTRMNMKNILWGELEVTTKTGANFVSPIQAHAIWLNILDELSGEIKEHAFNFSTNGRLVITKIVFD